MPNEDKKNNAKEVRVIEGDGQYGVLVEGEREVRHKCETEAEARLLANPIAYKLNAKVVVELRPTIKSTDS